MSRDGRLLGPVAAALRSIYSPTRATSTTAMPTTILTTFSPTELMSLSPSSRPVSFGLVNRQWSNSISSFVKMINTTTWKIDSGSDLPPLTVSMNFSAEEVPALVIDVSFDCLLVHAILIMSFLKIDYAVGTPRCQG